jgi:Thermostable hemolysin
VCRKVGATANLDTSCARRLCNTAGRGEETGSRSNKERCAALKPLDKKHPIQGGRVAIIVVTRADRMRSAVEEEIGKLYWHRYAARLSSFPDVLVAEVGASGKIECAAGIRFGYRQLFSECYLERPAEHSLSRRFGLAVHRERVVEVCNLAAAKVGRSRLFIRQLIEFVELAGAEWAIFTATKALRALLRRSGLEMIELARADQRRVGNPEDWGTYYEHDPRVMAVSRGMASERKRSSATPVLGAHA